MELAVFIIVVLLVKLNAKFFNFTKDERRIFGYNGKTKLS